MRADLQRAHEAVRRARLSLLAAEADLFDAAGDFRAAKWKRAECLALATGSETDRTAARRAFVAMMAARYVEWGRTPDERDAEAEEIIAEMERIKPAA